MGQRPGTNPNDWMPKCGAQLRGQPGKFCQKAPLKDQTRCEFHGGKSPKGMESPKFKEGRYIDVFKGHPMAERIKAAREDATLLELVGEIALMQAIIEELCSRFAENGNAEGAGTVKQIRKIYDNMVMAGVKKDMPTFNHLLGVLGDTLEAAEQQFALVEEIKSAVKAKKDLVDSQTKREFQLQQMMKVDEVRTFVVQLIATNRNIIYGRIEDKELAESILTEVATEFARLIGEGNSSGTNRALSEG